MARPGETPERSCGQTRSRSRLQTRNALGQEPSPILFGHLRRNEIARGRRGQLRGRPSQLLPGRLESSADLLLGLPARPVTPGSPALVIAAGDLQAAMPIDRVVGLDWFDAPLPLEANDRRPGAAFATGLVPHAGDYAPLLDAGRLLEALRAPWTPSAAEAR